MIRGLPLTQPHHLAGAKTVCTDNGRSIFIRKSWVHTVSIWTWLWKLAQHTDKNWVKNRMNEVLSEVTDVEPKLINDKSSFEDSEIDSKIWVALIHDMFQHSYKPHCWSSEIKISMIFKISKFQDFVRVWWLDSWQDSSVLSRIQSPWDLKKIIFEKYTQRTAKRRSGIF